METVLNVPETANSPLNGLLTGEKHWYSRDHRGLGRWGRASFISERLQNSLRKCLP